VQPNPAAQRKLQENYTPTGKIGNVRIVSLHTDKDGLVIKENEDDYLAKVRPTNFTSAIVVESAPSHCGFTPAEAAGAWESLLGWVKGGKKPTPASIQERCENAVPAFGGACRVTPSIDRRIRPR
jgi:hypothetical protein